MMAALPARSATVLVLRFHNASQFPDLDWIGESVSETLDSELAKANQIVLDRDTRIEGLKRLSLRSDTNFTKATLIRLGQSLDADYLVYGSYDVASSPNTDSPLKDSSIQLTAHFIDLRKLHNGPDISEAGKLTDLRRFKGHLAWQTLKYIDPKNERPVEPFLSPTQQPRLDAEESYIRGLLASGKDNEQKWFLQAVNLDPHYSSPAYELGKLYIDRKDYRQAVKWLGRIPAGDTRFPDARFRMGLCAYSLADFNSAANYFRDVVKLVPLNEVYNNLAAAEDQLNQPTSIGDFRRALEGDPNDPVYLFNLGAALLRANYFDEAIQKLEAAAGHSDDDRQAEDMLARARERVVQPPGSKPLVPARLKPNLDSTAFRQLKAVLQSKGSG
jgi:tetratricopeptide (TPR) repeat protein